MSRSKRNKRLYQYSDDDVVEYNRGLADLATLFGDLPNVKVVERDPNDDVIIACAIASSAAHIVTRDKDPLSIKQYEQIVMITPEDFLHALRKAQKGDRPVA